MKALFWLLCACALAAQTVTVTGSVTNAITHEPIEGVSVLLPSIRASGGKSDASGRFRIPNVKTGQYRLVLSRAGFESASKEIRIEDGADPPPFDVTMAPWPGVQGRVLDPGRQPVAGIRVRAISVPETGVVCEATTDAAGHYALKSLAPGQYRFVAMPPVTGNSAESMELAPTWFPSITDQHDAPTVTLVPGTNLFGYDIFQRAIPVFHIFGTILDERGEPAAGATVETSMATGKATTRDDGTFDLARVRQGEVAVRATWRRGDLELRGFAHVLVSGHDVQDLAVRVEPPVAFSGDIELNGQPRHPCEGEAILVPVDGEGERVHAEFTENGIRFKSVYPGRYRLIVLPGWTWGRHYLESVRLGPRDITLDEFEVVPGMTPFRVVLSTEGGRVRGTVENGNGGIVVLTPKEGRLRFRPFIVVGFFEGGSFAFDNVRPGDYYIFALRGSFNSDEMQNSAYAQPYLDGAKTLRVERSSTATATLVYVTAASDH